MEELFAKDIKAIKSLVRKQKKAPTTKEKSKYSVELVKIISLISGSYGSPYTARSMDKKLLSFLRTQLALAGVGRGAIKRLTESGQKIVRCFSLTKYNCNKKLINKIFKENNFSSLRIIVDYTPGVRDNFDSTDPFKSIREKICGKYTLKKNSAGKYVPGFYKPSKYSIEDIEQIISLLSSGLKERKAFEKSIENVEEKENNKVLKLSGWQEEN